MLTVLAIQQTIQRKHLTRWRKEADMFMFPYTKSMTDLLGVAGAIEADACVKEARKTSFPPTINLTEQDEAWLKRTQTLEFLQKQMSN